MSSNKGYPNTRAIPICHILIPKEVHKKLLLSLDPLREESPEHHCIASEAHGISQQQLGAQTPPEESEVRRVAQMRVHPRGDQAVCGLLLALYDVVEVRARRDHGGRTDNLAGDHEEDTRAQQSVAEYGRKPGTVREEKVGEQAFEEGGCVGDVVFGAVLGQQEGGDLSGAGVVAGGGPELEEVEDAEDGEEGRNAPERGGLEKQGVEGQGDGEHEHGAQEKGPRCYACEGLGLPRQVLGIVGIESGREFTLACGGLLQVDLCMMICMRIGENWSSSTQRRRPRPVLWTAGGGRPLERRQRWLHSHKTARWWCFRGRD